LENVLPPVEFTHCEAQGEQHQSLRRRRFVGGEIMPIFIGVRLVLFTYTSKVEVEGWPPIHESIFKGNLWKFTRKQLPTMRDG
jgi:hypothetical protein